MGSGIIVVRLRIFAKFKLNFKDILKMVATKYLQDILDVSAKTPSLNLPALKEYGLILEFSTDDVSFLIFW